MSRLGRNYIESGTYIERIFPMYNVRYIAITDDFDSIRPNTDITMPLKILLMSITLKTYLIKSGQHFVLYGKWVICVRKTSIWI